MAAEEQPLITEKVQGEENIIFPSAKEVYIDKIRGMLFGVAIGDALGAPHEFRRSIPLEMYTGHLIYEPQMFSRFQGERKGVVGQVTDDTEMTIALANNLANNGEYIREKVILSYENWANSKPMGMGKNTRRLLEGVKTVSGYEKRYTKALGKDLMDIQSNGSLMRASPLAILVQPENTLTFNPVSTDSNITNPNPVNEEASHIYIYALNRALAGFSATDIFDELGEGMDEYVSVIRQVFVEIFHGIPRDVTAIGKGWVVHGLYAGLLALHLYDNYSQTEDITQPFSETINQIILMGGDTDTNAAIAGAMIGAYVGYNAMMEEETTRNNLDIIINTDTSAGDFSRPDVYHPKTIFQLAERLAEI